MTAASDYPTHGGGLDAARARFGGAVEAWLDLSTGLNPRPFAPSPVPERVWARLPDAGATQALSQAARLRFGVPQGAEILPVPGLSVAIATLPRLAPAGTFNTNPRSYQEHRAAFLREGWREQVDANAAADAVVTVHPNNPDGALTEPQSLRRGARLTIIDESFADVAPWSLLSEADTPGTVLLRSFGKFYGLAGLRLGFVIGDPEVVSLLEARLGPWPVSGPALWIGRHALEDDAFHLDAATRLARSAERLDAMMARSGWANIGGTSLFRLYDVGAGGALRDALARHHIWTRAFDYAPRWLRMGLPGPEADWARLEKALAAL
ncbi:MAG: aminotransferase class I/II-fold pyridoxal phosphate-dependent enzyme [Pseudomonadota bacterium]